MSAIHSGTKPPASAPAPATETASRRSTAPAESASSEAPGPASVAATTSTPAPAATALGLPEPGRECEKLGLVEITLARERYDSILEIGCAEGRLARALVDRCASYTGMDTDADALELARRRVPAGATARFLPLTLPLVPPPGEHELVILREVLQLLDTAAVEDIARRLAAHAPCVEIVVVGARDELAGERDPVLDTFVAAFGDGVVVEALAMRRRYRIDALRRERGD